MIAVYCVGCARRCGWKTGKTQIRMFCSDPACRFTPPASAKGQRDDMILVMHANGVHSSALAQKFGVSRQRIDQIVLNGRRP